MGTYQRLMAKHWTQRGETVNRRDEGVCMCLSVLLRCVCLCVLLCVCVCVCVEKDEE